MCRTETRMSNVDIDMAEKSSSRFSAKGSRRQADMSNDVSMRTVCAPEAEEITFTQKSIADDTVPPNLAMLLERLANMTAPPGAGERTVFHAHKSPSLPMIQYMERLAKYWSCSGECFVIALIYVDRAIKSKSKISVDHLSVHRVLSTCLMLASKYQDDVYYSNAFYAKVAGYSLKDMNNLEVDMLTLLNHRLYVSPQDFEQYHKLISDMRAQ